MNNFQIVKAPEIVPMFLEICPEFQIQWNEHLQYWGNQERGEYIDISEFARFVVDCYASGKIERFPQIFEKIEALLTNGHPKIKELVTIGLLEDIQTGASHHDFGPDVFLGWLGPISRQVWFGIAKAWEGNTSLMDVLREEIKSKKAGS